MGAPRELTTRPKLASPTATVMPSPVSTTSMPQCRPSVASMAMQRTTPRWMWEATSMCTSGSPLGLLRVYRRLLTGGSMPSGK